MSFVTFRLCRQTLLCAPTDPQVCSRSGWYNIFLERINSFFTLKRFCHVVYILVVCHLKTTITQHSQKYQRSFYFIFVAQLDLILFCDMFFVLQHFSFLDNVRYYERYWRMLSRVFGQQSSTTNRSKECQLSILWIFWPDSFVSLWNPCPWKC